MKKNSGFSLIEVMIAGLIVATSIGAIVKLQLLTFATFQRTELRLLASNLADEKLNDLQYFDSIHGIDEQLSYVSIQTNQGGQISTGTKTIWINQKQQVKHQFLLTWQVEDQYFVDSDNDETADLWVSKNHQLTPVPLPRASQRKTVAITVSWQQNTELQTFTLSAIISPTPLNRLTMSNNSSDEVSAFPPVYTTAPPPLAIHRKEAHRSSYTHSRQNISFSETSTLKHEITMEKVDIDTQQVISRLEYKTLFCSCAYKGIGQGKSPAMHRLSDDQLYVETGNWLTKETGEALSEQEPLCDVCCRDHHGSSTMDREHRNYMSPDKLPHQHYSWDENQGYKPVSTIDEPYQEMCRFIRNDGDFELTSDWHAVDMLVMPDSELTEPMKDQYRHLVVQRLRGYLLEDQQQMDHFIPRISQTNVDKQLRTVTLYIDPLLPEDIDNIKTKIRDNDDTWTGIVPFYELDTTMQTHWESEFPELISVSNDKTREPFNPQQGQYGSSSSGRVIGHESGTSAIRTRLNTGNSGLLGMPAVTPQQSNDTLVRNKPIIVNHQSNSEHRISGLIHCIDTRLTQQKACYNNPNVNLNHLLSNIRITLSDTNTTCKQTRPKVIATPYFRCALSPEAPTGNIIVDKRDMALPVSFYWILPSGKRVDGMQLSLEETFDQDLDATLRLVIEITD